MLKFKIFEIPEEQSEKTFELGSDELDLGELAFRGGMVHIEFYRTLHFVRTQFTVDAKVELICDRSLEAFDYEVHQDYEVLFKAEQVEESADENGAVRNYDHASKQIDLEQDVRDTILLNLPTKKLHPRFLDEDGNPKEVLNEQFGDIPEDEEDQIDPRWEKLKELKEQR
ncbi:YceD family protein [Gracilimonas halophila]|uniref:YceD family protein n=1 Tax=Gracilimonas halophila TaxID=1834464 RepID=A0ABW5JJU1_9BACT